MSEQLRLEGEAAASRDVVEGARLRIQARKLREVAGAAERQLGLAPEPPQLPAGPGLPPNTALPAQFTPGAASVPPDWAAIREAIQAVGQRWLWGQSPWSLEPGARHQQIMAMREQGKSVHAITVLLGITDHTVTYHLGGLCRCR